MRHILRCENCGKYTMKERCCGQAITTKPARYSPGKFAEYRRKARENNLKERGLL